MKIPCLTKGNTQYTNSSTRSGSLWKWVSLICPDILRTCHVFHFTFSTYHMSEYVMIKLNFAHFRNNAQFDIINCDINFGFSYKFIVQFYILF